MRILITGANGFVGRALVARLAPDHDIVAVDQEGKDGPYEFVRGDLCDPDVMDRAVGSGVDALIHLATVPGGAAEEDPERAWRVNVDASRRLVGLVVQRSPAARVLFASSIAVLGNPLPPIVDDHAPVAPTLLYGAHKAIIEAWLATLTRRGECRALSLRLPGIVARPRGPSGMRSAFMSDVFHAALAGERLTIPVSPTATMWLMSLGTVVDNFVHALETPIEGGSVTLPALRISMAELVAAIASRQGIAMDFVTYAPDEALEAAFGRYPALSVPKAEAMGFRHDGSSAALVERAFAAIAGENS